MNNLPHTWLNCRLGDIIDYGTTQKVEPINISNDAWVLELEDIEKDTSKILQRLTFSQRKPKSTKNRFVVGDILYGKLRPYLNKIVRADNDGYCTTEIIPLTPPEWLDGRYLFYWLKNSVFLNYVMAVSHGLNMPRLGTEAGREAPFIFAPLNEQKRIADKLDSILARVDACREHFDRIPAILKRFRQSVLAAATSGKLTEDWRNEMGMHLNDWESVFLNNLVRESANGLSKRRGQSGKETIVLRLADFKKSERVYGNERTIMLEEKEQAKYGLIEKDLLVVRVNGSRDLAGKFIEYKNINNSLETYCDHFIRLRLDLKRIIPKFAVFVSNSGMGRRYIESVLVTSAGQNTINQTALLRLSLNLPLLSEQTEIVRRVEELFAYAGRIEARYQAARARIEKLTPSVLAKAFRGELVPQDPNDEPVSMLLERIRKALPATKQRGRSKANPAAAS